MKKIICLLLLIVAVSPKAQASCSFSSGVTSEIPGYISFGNVVVQRDAAVGSVLATTTTGAYNGGNSIAGCTQAWTFRWEMTKWSTLSSIGNGVYNTNLAGVGIRLTSPSGRIFPFDMSVSARNSVTINGDGNKAELVKTGDITGGTLDTGVLARASIVNQFYIANVTLNGTNTVTSVACSVTSVDEPVQLGDHNKREFSGVGYTTDWKGFNIVLDCNKSAHIYVQIDATRDASNAPGVMAIDSESGSTAATGVGVQLYFAPDNSAAQFGQVKDYYTSPNGGMETVQLKARYYQTASAVTAGPANATATFTLTYK